MDSREIRIPPNVNSLASFRAWYLTEDFPEQGQVCYLAGEIWVDTNPQLLSSHVAAKADIGSALSDLSLKLELGEFFGPGIRIVSEQADYSTEPDGCYVTWKSFDEGRVRLTPTLDGEDYLELVGAPDMVIEVVGPSSERRDTEVLPRLYHIAGIREYWLVDGRAEQLSFDILRSTPEGYVSTFERDGWRRSRVLGHDFRLDRERNRIGIWEYTLRNRPNA
jgi:Uma2 family endonuclease